MRKNKKIILFLISILFISRFIYGAEVKYTSLQIPGFVSDIIPGSTNLVNMLIKIENLDLNPPPHTLRALRVTFTGGQYIMDNSVDLRRDNDGDLSTLTDNNTLLIGDPTQLLSVQNNIVNFQEGVNMNAMDIDPGETKHIYISFSINTANLNDRDAISAFINSTGDITMDSGVTLITLDMTEKNTYYIQITADHYQINPVVNQIAGVSFPVTLAAVDQWGNKDIDFVSTVAISGASVNTPLSAPDGTPPYYPASLSAWNNGEITISGITLYAAQGQVQLNASDGSWSVDSDPFSVVPDNGNPRGLTMDEVSDVIVGDEFSVVLRLFDSWQNPLTEVNNNITVHVTGEGENAPGESPDGIKPFYPSEQETIFWGNNAVHIHKTFDGKGIRLFAYESDRQLRATIKNVPGVGELSVVSNTFDVVPDPLGPSELVVTAYPETVYAGEAFDITVTAYDKHKNIYKGYNKSIRFISSDKKAVVPPVFSMPEGTMTFSKGVTFFSANRKHSLIVEETESLAPLSAQSTRINVLPLSDVSRFDISTPPKVTAGEPFNLVITSYDPYDNVSGSSGEIEIKLKQGKFKVLSGPFLYAPSLYQQSDSIHLMNGVWSGSVVVSAESLTNSFIVSVGGIIFQQEAPFIQAVPNAQKDMNYPNPFSSLRETTTIRYYLHADSHVDIRIYTLTGNIVREWGIDGSQGINLLTWDGKDGNGNTVGSGGYLCAIWKKGFRSIWSNGLNHKPIIVKIAVVN